MYIVHKWNWKSNKTLKKIICQICLKFIKFYYFIQTKGSALHFGDLFNQALFNLVEAVLRRSRNHYKYMYIYSKSLNNKLPVLMWQKIAILRVMTCQTRNRLRLVDRELKYLVARSVVDQQVISPYQVCGTFVTLLMCFLAQFSQIIIPHNRMSTLVEPTSDRQAISMIFILDRNSR